MVVMATLNTILGQQLGGGGTIGIMPGGCEKPSSLNPGTKRCCQYIFPLVYDGKLEICLVDTVELQNVFVRQVLPHDNLLPRICESPQNGNVRHDMKRTFSASLRSCTGKVRKALRVEVFP